jgi:hypothetical protein
VWGKRIMVKIEGTKKLPSIKSDAQPDKKKQGKGHACHSLL